MGRNTTAMKRGFNYDKANTKLAIMVDGTDALDLTTTTVTNNLAATNTGAVTNSSTLTQTGVATFTAQDVHSAGLTVASTFPVVGGTLATPKMTLTTLTSATSYTITAAQLLGGFISDTSSTGAIAATLPTVASVVALLPGYVAGTSFRFVYKNPGNQTVTLTTGTTWTMVGTMTIATTKAREFIFIIAGATTGSCYALGEFSY